ncbi:MAG: aminopeptidase [Selenomonadaceae bacterium]|nr:aminopeptidase [Selenomonadaceae bacterium]
MTVFQERLRKLARLAVRVGVNLQEDQLLVINAPIECAEFARLAAEEAYEAGAHDVVLSWNDEQMARIRYEKAKDAVFSEFPSWRQKFYMDYAEQGAAFLSIAAQDPEIFRSVAPDRLLRSRQAAGAALMEYRERLMKNRNTWCVVSVPTRAWAKKVFPDVSADEAAARLWEEIFRTVRVSEASDPVEEWGKHTSFLAKAAAFMNDHAFHALHYQNGLGTDLTIRLPEGHIWAGGAETSDLGTVFVANMPTEEVYTAPQRDGVDGTVYATRPLVYEGNLIENFSIVFEKGKAVSCTAEKGEEHLKSLLAVDEGASYLGEVALVPYDSPISKSGVLFYNTLFDENASCHLAFGKAYPTCLKNGEKMASVELLQHGLNDSLVHEDFMVGSGDLSITGIQKDGTKVPVFVDGRFAFK